MTTTATKPTGAVGDRLGGVFVEARAVVAGRPVVIKTLADHLTGDPLRPVRFLRAVELGMRLSHPNVVRVLEAGVDGRPYVVMEHIDGESLAERTQRCGRLSAAETLTLATHLAAGLAHAHANGVVHGALGTHSIVLGADNVVRIGDFGFARLIDEAERHGTAEDVYGLAMVLRHTGAHDLPPGLSALIDAAAAGPSVRPSAFDVFHQVVTLTGPPKVWRPPAGVRLADH